MDDKSSVAIIHKYFPNLQSRQIEQFSRLEGLYKEWNSRINVISRKDVDSLYEHHVLHSLAIAKVVNFVPQAEVVDVGTGGGFPGIPLAILFPNTHFHLIDSIAKKLKVVDAIASELQLANITSQHIRAEQLTAKYDFVVSRAVTAASQFMLWIKGIFFNRQLHEMPNGVLFLKGGDITGELGPYGEKTKIFSISDFFSEPFFEEKKVVYLPG